MHTVCVALNSENNKILFSHSVFQVSLVLEPLPELYDTSSSVPTTDASLDVSPAQGSSKPQVLAPSQQPRQTRVTIADQESVNNSRATTPRYLFFPHDKILVYFAVHNTFFKQCL